MFHTVKDPQDPSRTWLLIGDEEMCVAATLTRASERDEIPAYSYNTFDALERCETFGIIDRVQRKSIYPPNEQLSGALAAGRVMHNVFAVIRAAWLAQTQNYYNLAHARVKQLFPEHYDAIVTAIDAFISDNSTLHQLALLAVEISPYEDDSRDKRRTRSNLEVCAIECARFWQNKSQIYIGEADDAPPFIGIEQPFDILIQIPDDVNIPQFRLIGIMDGVHYHADNTIRPHEGKSASRINQSWLAGMTMSMQITTYLVALHVLSVCDPRFQKSSYPIGDTVIIEGIQVPKPASEIGFVEERIPRNLRHFTSWAQWVMENALKIHLYNSTDPNDVPHIPRRTHSCNRFFSTCPLLPFCDSDAPEASAVYEDMYTREPFHLFESTATATDE